MESRPEYLYIAIMRAVVRFCRISRAASSGGLVNLLLRYRTVGQIKEAGFTAVADVADVPQA